MVECQDERSQHKNRARAMALLQAKLLTGGPGQAAAEQAAQRKSLVGRGDRSERIRTYNFPQGRVTDHRINLTLYKLDEILEGALDQRDRPADSGAPGRPSSRPWAIAAEMADLARSRVRRALARNPSPTCRAWKRSC